MKIKLPLLAAVALVSTVFTARSSAATLQITFHNASPDDGTWIMRPWMGLHDGGFQTFTVGAPAPSQIEHIAEDGVSGDTSHPTLLSGPSNACSGNPEVYNADMPCMVDVFGAYAGGAQQIAVGGPTIPGATLLANLPGVNPNDPKSKYLSFIVMVIPSNDAFFGTDSAHPIRVYDAQGRFNGGKGPIRIKVQRKDILDAGTEENTEIRTDTAFFGQTVSGTGTHPDPANPVVHPHPGFGSSIVDGFNIFPGSQINYFSRVNQGGLVAEVTIVEIP